MSRITVLGIDPSFRNFGLALVEVDLLTKEMFPTQIRLIVTEPTKDKKQVRVSSDKLRRAREAALALRDWEKLAHIAGAEIPSGAQSASAANGLGIALGVVAGHTIPLIEVNAAEAKLAAVGNKTASKREMINWAYDLWPDLQWNKVKSGRLVDNNEHMADALAIVKATTLTPAFDQAAAMMFSMMRAAE